MNMDLELVHELVLEGSFERWFSIGYLHLHMLLCWLSFEHGFILGIFLGLGMVIPSFRNGLRV